MQRRLGDPSASDSFVVTSLRADGMSMRTLLTLVSLALVLVVVLGGTAYLLVKAPDVQQGAPGGVTEFHLLPTSTPVPLPPGWRQPIADQIQSLAFAAGAPNVGYACTITPAASAIYITQDGGQSWQKSAGPDPHLLFIGDSGVCSIAVNPYNSQEIAVEYAVCTGKYCGPAGLPWKLARSFDGGQHWTFPYAPSGTTSSPNAFSNIVAWTSDGMFFISGVSNEGQQLSAIAASDHGGVFAWTTGYPSSQDPSFPNPPVSALYGLGTTLYATLSAGIGTPDPLPYPTGTVSVSVDHGAHWALAQPFASSPAPAFENIAANGKTLVAYNNGVLQRSDDGGVTWLNSPQSQLPNFPQLILDPSFIVATPDGGFIAMFSSDVGPDYKGYRFIPPHVFIAHPDAASWQHVVDLVDPHNYWYIQPVAVTLNEQGRPIDLWGVSAAGPGSLIHYAVEYPLP